jgi:hypothetical protein
MIDTSKALRFAGLIPGEETSFVLLEKPNSNIHIVIIITGNKSFFNFIPPHKVSIFLVQ